MASVAGAYAGCPAASTAKKEEGEGQEADWQAAEQRLQGSGISGVSHRSPEPEPPRASMSSRCKGPGGRRDKLWSGNSKDGCVHWAPGKNNNQRWD